MTFKGTKTFTGYPEGQDAPTFTYTLSEGDNVLQSKTTKGAGDYAFDAITYTEAGTYSYTVKETKGDAEGVTYDSTIYNITVTVTDDGSGKLKAEVTGADPTALNFTNSYAQQPGRLIITKTVSGDLTAGDLMDSLKFKVENEEGTYSKEVAFTEFMEHATSGVYVYELSDVPAGNYTVTEVGYEKTNYKVSIHYAIGNDSSVKYTTPDAKVTVNAGEMSAVVYENTYTRQKGLLVLEKRFVGNEGNIPADLSFTVTGPDNYSRTIKYSEFTDGVYKLKDIPTGNYTVVENNPSIPNFSVITTYEVNGKAAATPSCTLENGAVIGTKLTFINTYQELVTNLTIKGSKALTGAELKAEQFEFNITQAEDDYRKVSFDSTTKNTIDGNFNFQIVFTREGVFNFTVSEKAGDDSTVIYDDTKYPVQVKVVLDGIQLKIESVNGNPITDNTYTLESGNKAASFVNELKPGSLTVSKKVEGSGADQAKEFTFTITLDDTSINETYSGVEFKAGVAEITLKGGESKTIEGLPNGVGYTVTEQDYSAAGYTTTAKTGDTGTIAAGETKTAAFTNTYKAAPAEVTFSGTKTFNGYPEGAALPTFTYTLSEDGKVIDTQTTAGGGSYAFATIKYTEAGEHNYVVKETAGTAAGVTYDAKEYSLKVTVTDDGSGKLAAAISGDSTTGTDLNFTNTYKAAPVEVTFKGSKTFTGYPEGADAPTFTYTLSEDGTVIDTQTTAGAGTITFKTLQYDTAGEHNYVVKETKGEIVDVTYDETTYALVVTVTDDGSGKLTAAISGDSTTGTDLNFTNTFARSMTSVEGTKTWVECSGEKTHDNAAEITLTLKRSVNGGAEETLDLKPTWTGEKYSFADLEKYDLSGNEYTYTVTEAPVTGYESTQDGFNFTNTQVSTIFTAKKIWVDDDNSYKVRPASVTFMLSDGSKIVLDGTPDETGETEAWVATWSNLPKYDAEGKEIEYTAVEVDLDSNYTVSYADGKKYAVNQGEITNTVKLGELKLSKVINGLTGEEIDALLGNLSFTITGPNGFEETIYYSEFTDGSYTLTDLVLGKYTVTENGAEIEGIVLTAENDGKTVTVEENETAALTITNSYSEPTSVTVRKSWASDSEYTNRLKAKCTVTLYANGVAVDSVELDHSTTKHTFTNLPKYDADGKEIEYTVLETKVPTLYRVTYGGSMQRGFTIKNTYRYGDTTPPGYNGTGTGSGGDGSTNRGGAQPGDESNIQLWAAGSILALGGAGTMTAIRTKKRREEKSRSKD